MPRGCRGPKKRAGAFDLPCGRPGLDLFRKTEKNSCGRNFPAAARVEPCIMKTFTLSLIALALGAAPVKAQIFQPNIVNGAVLGGIAGAVIGHNSGHHAGEGALIGALGGAALGSLVQPPSAAYAPPAPVYYAPPPPAVVYAQPAPVVVEQTYAPAVYPAPVYYGYYGYGWGRPWGHYYGPGLGISFGYRGGWGHDHHR